MGNFRERASTYLGLRGPRQETKPKIGPFLVAGVFWGCRDGRVDAMVFWPWLFGLGFLLLADRRHCGVRPVHVLAGVAQVAIQRRMSPVGAQAPACVERPHLAAFRAVGTKDHASGQVTGH